MISTKVDLILHPVRLRILQTLAVEPLTTQEIANRLVDVPKSSIYRHLRLLLDGDMVEIAETRLVNGIQEKIYQLIEMPHLTQDDMAGMTPTEHLQAFATYIFSLLRDFAGYLDEASNRGPEINLQADRVGYTEATFFASTGELDALGEALRQAVSKLVGNQAGKDRRPFKLAVITYPMPGSSGTADGPTGTKNE